MKTNEQRPKCVVPWCRKPRSTRIPRGFNNVSVTKSHGFDPALEMLFCLEHQGSWINSWERGDWRAGRGTLAEAVVGYIEARRTP